MKLVKGDVIYSTMNFACDAKRIIVLPKVEKYITDNLWDRVEDGLGLGTHSWNGVIRGWITEIE